MAATHYSFELKNHLAELLTLQQHVGNFGRIFGLSDSCLVDITVGLDELFTNIVSYGFKEDGQHFVRFTVAMDGDLLTIHVEDEGIPFNPLEAKDPERPLDLTNIRIGGLGIFSVKRLMDDICYTRERGKNNLTLKKHLQAPA